MSAARRIHYGTYGPRWTGLGGAGSVGGWPNPSSNQFPPSPVSWASSSTSVVHGSLPIGCALSGWLCDARRQFAQRWFQSQQGGSVSVNVGPFSKNLGPKRRRSQVRRRIISGRYTYWLKQSRSRRRPPSEQPACPRGPTGLLTRAVLPWTTWTSYCQTRGTFFAPPLTPLTVLG